MDVVVQGLLLGGLYATAALGLSLVFGTMRLVNLAHGQFLVVGAYLTSILVSIIGGDPLLLAIPVALVVGLLAYPIQRYIFTPVMAQGEEAPITAAFGVGLAIQTILILVFSSDPKSLTAPYATAQLNLFGIPINVSLLIATAIGIAIVIILTFVLKRTPFGRQVRAASLDAEAAGLVGIDVKKTYARVMAISAATASIGGVLVAMSFAIAPSSGTGWLLRAFTVVVIGGLGSLPGTIYGGLIVGLVESVGAVTIGPQYRDLVVFGVLVIILIVRPNGLFTKAVRA
ncbi:MAG: branched-chain amino acid ABC transporter permease [Microbacteriaceae bacterium]